MKLPTALICLFLAAVCWTPAWGADGWTLVLKSGKTVRCQAPPVIVNGAYLFRAQDGKDAQVPEADVDKTRTAEANGVPESKWQEAGSGAQGKAAPGSKPGPDPAGSVGFSIAGPWIGKADAPFTVVMFSDYQCPYCRRFHAATFPEFRKRLVDTGKVRFASIDVPLESHEEAFLASEAVRCAGEQGRKWELRDALMTVGQDFSEEGLTAQARRLSLNMGAFLPCLQMRRYAEVMKDDQRAAAAIGVDAVPAFVVGRSTSAGVTGVVIMGAHPLESFEEALKQFGAGR